jgi:hypothetical protein
MTEEALQSIGIATISQEIDSEGVTEAVGVSIGDASAFSEPTDEMEVRHG